MMLRKRQRKFVDKCSVPLKARGNTLGVAPTGAGKTVMMSAVALENAPKDLPTLTLQHREELVTQNRNEFIGYAGITEIRRPMTIDADTKSFDGAAGGWNFGMVQSVHNILMDIPKLGMLCIDEAHHSAAQTYLDIISRAKYLNPSLLLYGTTATPNRGDRKALRTCFDNCGDQIQIGEIIRDGHLIRPRTFVLDIGVRKELSQVTRTSQDFDMKEVESIMNKQPLNDKIVENWMGFTNEATGEWISCADRQTIAFCATVQHAKDLTAAFAARGFRAECVHGKMTPTQRRDVFARYDSRETQILINVAICTEGYDNQPTSCVILGRPSSWKSTMVQMIGRGLRKVNPEKYPGVIKDDCVVLDFGTSCLTHGSLEDEVNLSGAGVKMCPSCEATVPQVSKDCPICGHEFPEEVSKVCPKCKREHLKNVSACDCGHRFSVASTGSGGSEPAGVITDFVMSEIDILQDSPFKYESFYDGRVLICFGFNHWGAIIHYKDQRYYSIGAEANNLTGTSFKIHILNSSDSYIMALQSTDDYMRTKSNKTDARKVAKWRYESPTFKQLQLLGDLSPTVSMSKYRAACGIQFQFYGKQIQSAIGGHINATKEAKGYGS